MTAEHVDVLVVGAGISGIAAAYYLQTRCPTKTYTILEGRDAIGGTWDLFRILACVPIPTCSRLVIPSGPGPTRRLSRMVPRSCSMCARPRRPTESIRRSDFTTGCERRPGPRPRPAGPLRSRVDRTKKRASSRALSFSCAQVTMTTTTAICQNGRASSASTVS